MKIKLIDKERGKDAKCYFCGTNKSVKYEIKISGNNIISDINRYSCNKCVLMFYDKFVEDDMDKYFDIHVQYDYKDGCGYSIPMIAKNKDEAIFLASKIANLFEFEEDVNYIDYVEEITKEEYMDMCGGNKNV